jgi:precorrin-3B C17-methyltransferase
VVAGYTTYIDLLRDLVRDKRVIATGMTRETERVEAALAEAMNGAACALVSSGDPGIYAMAGLVFELCEKKGIRLVRHRETGVGGGPGQGAEPAEGPVEGATVRESLPSAEAGESRETGASLELEIVPGIPALAAGASLLGAPLTHDFAAISLSDLMTPWETIEKRLEAAGRGDFVVVLYNPRSRKRNWQLDRAREILLEHRPGSTPVGIVTGAMRENQAVSIVTLDTLAGAEVDMQTIVFVGSTRSRVFLDFMFTPRGYDDKYGL